MTNDAVGVLHRIYEMIHFISGSQEFEGQRKRLGNTGVARLRTREQYGTRGHTTRDDLETINKA